MRTFLTVDFLLLSLMLLTRVQFLPAFKLFDMQTISDMFNLPLRHEELSIILHMAHSDSGTKIEEGGRRPVVALLCVHEGSFVQTSTLSIPVITMYYIGIPDFELFTNFLASAHTNAPEFSRKKLVIAAFDEKVATSCRYHV